MQGNSDDLIMQFARGTEALSCLEKLDALYADRDMRKRELQRQHDARLNSIDVLFASEAGVILSDSAERISALTSDAGDDNDDGEGQF